MTSDHPFWKRSPMATWVAVLAAWLRVAGLPTSLASRVAGGAVAGSLLLLVVLALVFPSVVLPGLGPTPLDLDSVSGQDFVRPLFGADEV